MGVSTRSWYVKAEKNECARGGRMCVNRVKNVGRVWPLSGDTIGRQSRCFTSHIHCYEGKRFVFEDQNPVLTDQHVSLQATHSHPHENTKKAKNGRKGGYWIPPFDEKKLEIQRGNKRHV